MGLPTEILVTTPEKMTSRQTEPNNQGDDLLRFSMLLGAKVDENRYCLNGLSSEFLFQEDSSALYHGKPQYYYDVPIQTEECEYDGEQKSDMDNYLYEESDNDDDIGDSDTDNFLYDEDNDAMLEDDNFSDNVDT
ncbi:unnamed protein product [Malus baccata var. baccata]